MKRNSIAVLLGILAAFALVLGVIAGLGANPALAQDKTLYWRRYDVDISVLSNGDLRIVETQELVFTNGTFRFGVRTIPHQRITAITDITVGEEGGKEYRRSASSDPETFSVTGANGGLDVRYNFPPSSSTRTIVIGYTLTGALRYYPANGVDQLYWKAVPAGNPFRTETARITMHLPPGAAFTSYGVYGPGYKRSFEGEGQHAGLRVGPIAAGQEVEVVGEWPHGIVAGEAKPWQRQLDFDAQWGPMLTLGLVGLGVLLIVGGPLLAYLWWYRRGRDAAVGLVADYLPEPPSELPPAVAGTLIDEHADVRDLIATILDLARRGVLEIEGVDAYRDFIYRRKPSTLPLRDYEEALLKALLFFGCERRLSSLRNSFSTSIPDLRDRIYAETVREGLFDAHPQFTRSRVTLLGLLGLGLAGMVSLLDWFLWASPLGEYARIGVLVPIGLGITAIALLVVARHMPRKTAKGADAAARWLAFKRYLQNVEKYTNVQEKGEIFERFLPYAVAFGLDQSWIRKFAQVEAPVPAWWIPYGSHPSSRDDQRRPSGQTTAVGRPEGSVITADRATGPTPVGVPSLAPSLDSMSRGMGVSLSNISAGLGTMLASAGDTLTSPPDQGGQSGGGVGVSWGTSSSSSHRGSTHSSSSSSHRSSGGGFSGGGRRSGGGSGGGGSRFG